MTFNPVVISAKKEKPDWYKGTAIYARPEMRKSALQLLNTLVPYILLLALMVYTVRSGYPYGITLLLGTAAAALYSRIFIFFHDCTHGSFLPSPKWNRNLGYLLGILTFTPFHDWRRTHAAHHITAGDLDRRGFGDITTMTVQEYLQAPLGKRLYYRLYRHPLIMFGLGPGYYFLLRNRFTTEGARKDDHISVFATNAAIGAIMVATGLTLDFKTYFAVQLPIVLMAATLGIWLFYIQHQFQGVYWARHEEWDPWQVVMTGASYYKLPKPLQWITGNIGFHHVHHMRPGIPNYTLEKCYREVPQLQQIEPLTIRKSLHSLRLHLYDEENRKMVSFKEARQQRRRER